MTILATLIAVLNVAVHFGCVLFAGVVANERTEKAVVAEAVDVVVVPRSVSSPVVSKMVRSRRLLLVFL